MQPDHHLDDRVVLVIYGRLLHRLLAHVLEETPSLAPLLEELVVRHALLDQVEGRASEQLDHVGEVRGCQLERVFTLLLHLLEQARLVRHQEESDEGGHHVRLFDVGGVVERELAVGDALKRLIGAGEGAAHARRLLLDILLLVLGILDTQLERALILVQNRLVPVDALLQLTHVLELLVVVLVVVFASILLGGRGQLTAVARLKPQYRLLALLDHLCQPLLLIQNSDGPLHACRVIALEAYAVD